MKQPTQSERINMMLRGIANAKADAIGCDECFELLDRCADLVEAGQSLEKIHPEIEKHLEDCFCCSAEFQALLTALRAVPSPTE